MKLRGWRRPAPRSATAGEAAEQVAAAFLSGRGLTVKARNVASRRGEIDIVARDDQTLVFVEVRLRSNSRFGSGADSVDARKQQRLVRAAAHYLAHHYGATPPACRFDVLSLAPAPEQSPPYRVEWLRDAFRPDF